MDHITNELHALLIQQQKENTYHLAPEQEFQFYRRVAQGDLTILDGDLNADPREGMGILSNDPLRNTKYHLIILIAMITRMCMEEGLPTEEAYTLSDLYIRRIDLQTSIDALSALKREAVTRFTKQMHDNQKKRLGSLPVVKAIDYIDGHLTESLTVGKIAGHIGCNADHLSRLFKKETGVSLSRFLLERKCHTARYLLENSSISCTDIAAFLGFSSCSHFIERFKQAEGTTPEAYRASKIRRNLSDIYS